MEHIEKWILTEGEHPPKIPIYCILLYTETSFYVKMEEATKDLDANRNSKQTS